MKLTAEQLDKLTKGQLNYIDRMLTAINSTCLMYEINTPLRFCHWFAQILHETGNFTWWEELASGKAYEGRKDLGNLHPGDGVKYKGRGWLQTTGEENYRIASKELGHDFVTNPDDLKKLPWAALAAGLFWKQHDLNQWADKDSVLKITHIINGGENGLQERIEWLQHCKSILMP